MLAKHFIAFFAISLINSIKTGVRMLDSIHAIKITLKSHFWRKNFIILSLFCMQRCYERNNVSRKSVNL